MTDDQTTTEAPAEDQTDDQNPNRETESDQPQTPENPNQEAARYRHRAKEAEARAEELAGQVTALRRAAVDDRVKSHRIAPEGFWASGVQLEELLNEDGHIDDDKVRTAADNAAETLGLQRIGTRGPHVPKEGRTTNPSGSQGWKAAFAPK